jgi:hypothetical protein
MIAGIADGRKYPDEGCGSGEDGPGPESSPSMLKDEVFGVPALGATDLKMF